MNKLRKGFTLVVIVAVIVVIAIVAAIAIPALTSSRPESTEANPSPSNPGWELPSGASQHRIAADELFKDSSTLGDVFNSSITLLAGGGYSDISTSNIPGGFIIATKVERFLGSGDLAPAEYRWVEGPPWLAPPTLSEIFSRVTEMPVSNYRLLLLVVTDEELVFGKPMSLDKAQEYSSGPNNTIENAGAPISSTLQCHFLIYHVQKDYNAPTKLVDPSPIPCIDQLQKAGIDLS